MTDAALVKQTLLGDKEAFGGLVERYRHQVYGLAYHHVRDFETATDLAQEAFVQAYLKLAQLRQPEKFVAWLRTLTTNICRMWLRRHEVQTVSLDEDPSTAHPSSHIPHACAEQAELGSLVRRAIDALPERQRLTVTMFYIDGLSYEDIAEFMDESVNAVESRLHRARSQLKERMMDMVGETFKPHHLTEEFTEEVLNKVRVLGIGIWGPEDMRLRVQDEREREFGVRLTSNQAVSISMELEGREPPRPMTHDLFKRILEAVGIKLEKVVLIDVRRGEFSSRMVFRCGEEAHAVDARAGEAVALALRTATGISATPTVLRKARRLVEPPSSFEAPSDASCEQEVSIYGAPASEEERKRDEREQEERQTLLWRRRRRWARLPWEKQVEVTVRDVSLEHGTQNTVVLLADRRGSYLPIWIGPYEAQAIGRALKDGQVNMDLPPSPKGPLPEFTHDLIKLVLDAFDVEIVRVAVDAFQNNVFFGVLALHHAGRTRYVDARPSDCIALALRFECPIFVTRNVWREVVITPGQVSTLPFEGTLEILEGSHGYVRRQPGKPSSSDICVSFLLVRQYGLKSGEQVKGFARPPQQGEFYAVATRIKREEDAILTTVQPPESRAPLQTDPTGILRLALRTAVTKGIPRPRITLLPEGEPCECRCRAVIKGKGNQAEWEQIGGVFVDCWNYLYGIARVNAETPFPQKGVARCAFQDKEYELHVTARQKPKLSYMELRLKPVN